MVKKAKVDFLHFKKGEEISESDLKADQTWIEDGLVEVINDDKDNKYDLNKDGNVDKEDISIAKKLVKSVRKASRR